MSTDQADTVAPAPAEASAPEPETTTLTRDVDAFLADLDAVLAASAGPAAGPGPELGPGPDNAATMPDVDLSLDAGEPPTTQAPAPAAWWDPLYRDDTADQDTFTGNVPAAAVPPKPTHAPDVPAGKDQADQDQAGKAGDGAASEDGDQAPAKKKRAWSLKKKGRDDEDGDEDEAPAAPTAEKGAKKAGKKGGGKKAGPAAVAAGNGLVNNPRGRQVIFAGTAYAMGWGLHLDDVVTGLIAHAEQYAVPVTACSLFVGLAGLACRTRLGGVVFVGSLGLITVLGMVRPAWVVGGGLALGLQLGYRAVRQWVGPHGAKWPWKGVVWAAHVPAVTATVTFLLYGTN